MLYAVADAFVRGGSYADRNFGSARTLLLKDGSSGNSKRRTFLRFDARSLDQVKRAWLRIPASLSRSGSLGLVVGATLGDWNEAAFTWNNQPLITQELGRINVVNTGTRFYEVEVTQHVLAARAAGTAAVDFGLTPAATSDALIEVGSKESTTLGATLVVE